MTSASFNFPITPNTGGELADHEIVGREGLVADLLAWLVHGSVRIEDPRRMGKTSTLKLLASYSTEEAPIVFVTVQGHSTADDIVLEIARELHDHLDRFTRIAESIRGFFDKATLHTGVVTFNAILNDTPASAKLEQMLDALSGKFPHGRLTIAVDELPWAIRNISVGANPTTQGPAAAGAFLQTLQRLRDKYPDIRWVMAGSIGFHHVLRLAGQTNAVLTGLRPANCGPLDDADAALLVRRLAAGAGIDNLDGETIDATAHACGGIPFIAHHLVELLAKRTDITAATVTEVFDDFVEDRSRSSELTHLLQRLEDYMDADDASLAYTMLDLCALKGPCEFDEFVALADEDRSRALRVANWLVDDHYLTPSYVWRYDVLRRVWVARRKLGGAA